MDVASYLLGQKSGGSGGTSDYEQLSNKPQINNVELSGNKSFADLGLETETYTEIIRSSSNSSPFVFSEKKLGIYFFSKNVTAFYTKLTPSSSTKGWSEKPIIMFYTRNPEGLTNARIGKVIYYSGISGEEYTKVASLVIYNGSLLIDDNGQDQTMFSGIFLTPGPNTQFISGIKRFASLPQCSLTPANERDLTPKKYVDDQISSAIGNINTILATLTTPSNSGGGE